MEKNLGYKLTPEAIRAIEAVLSQDKRAEVVPIRDGVKVFRLERREMKQTKAE